MRARNLLLVVAIAGMVAAAGCTSPTRSGGVSSLGNVSPVVTAPVTPSTSPPSIEPSTTAPPEILPCTTGDVSLNQQPGDSGAAGTIVVAIRVTNSSTHTCTLRGYPDFTLTAHSVSLSKDIDEPVTLSHGVFAGPVFGAKVVTVTLAPGAHAGFLLAYSQIHSDGTGNCDVANKLHLTLPGSTGTTVGPVQIPVCGQPMQISPLLPLAKVTL